MTALFEELVRAVGDDVNDRRQRVGVGLHEPWQVARF